jgi:hypothetical protein
MTVSNLLAAAPWIVFGVLLVVICIRLLGSS